MATTERIHEIELPLTIEYDYEPYVPAKISGPPEKCYPAEGGYVSINDVFLGSTSILSFIPQATLDSLANDIYIECAEAEADGPCDYPEPEIDEDDWHASQERQDNDF